MDDVSCIQKTCGRFLLKTEIAVGVWRIPAPLIGIIQIGYMYCTVSHQYDEDYLPALKLTSSFRTWGDLQNDHG